MKILFVSIAVAAMMGSAALASGGHGNNNGNGNVGNNMGNNNATDNNGNGSLAAGQGGGWNSRNTSDPAQGFWCFFHCRPK